MTSWTPNTFAGWLLAVILSSGPSLAIALPTTKATAPSADQRAEIEDLKNRAERAREAFDRARMAEMDWDIRAHLEENPEIAETMRGIADGWSQFADGHRIIEEGNRILAVQKVDEYYGLSAPPDTTYRYNPDSRVGGFVPPTSTKTVKDVVFCPNAFEFCADFLASIKLHELRHAWQVHNCMSDKPGYWADCTFWGHISEWDAYMQMERAHDSGTIPVSEEYKKTIRKKIKEHRRGAFRRWGVWFVVDHAAVLPGALQDMKVTVFNTTPQVREMALTVEDELGWAILPPSPVVLSLEPEGSQTIPFVVMVPPNAPMGLNVLRAVALGDTPPDETEPEDFAFLVVVPHVEIMTPERFMGFPGEEVVVEVILTSPRPAGDPAAVRVEFSNNRDWPLNPPFVLAVVSEEEAVAVQTSILLDTPTVSETTAVVITATVVPALEPTATVSRLVPVEIAQFDLMPIGTDEPPPRLYAGTPCPVSVQVLNAGKLSVDSSFDSTCLIHGPGAGAPLVYDERMTAGCPAGRELITVEFPSITFAEAGIYTATMTALAPPPGKQQTGLPDADPDNDVLVFTFEVIEAPTAVGEWGVL